MAIIRLYNGLNDILRQKNKVLSTMYWLAPLHVDSPKVQSHFEKFENLSYVANFSVLRVYFQALFSVSTALERAFIMPAVIKLSCTALSTAT